MYDQYYIKGFSKPYKILNRRALLVFTTHDYAENAAEDGDQYAWVQSSLKWNVTWGGVTMLHKIMFCTQCFFHII